MRILGLDLGSISVKAVEIDSAFGRYEVREYYEQPIAPGSSAVEAAAALVQSLTRYPDRICVALPHTWVTQRNLNIPTRDRKAVRSTVAFELEDDLPFEIEDCVYDYSVLSQGSQGSHVHISISLKRHVHEFLDALKAHNIDPDLVTSESWALRCYMNRISSRSSQTGPVLVVQIGSEETHIYAHTDGAPLFFHAIDWGGAHLTQAIAHELKLSFEEAEQAKRERGLRSPSNDSSEAIECKGEILHCLQTLLQEIRQAILTTRNLTHESPAALFFSGGGSIVQGLIEILSPELHTQIQTLQALSGISLSGVSYSEETDAKFLSAVALGLCLVGPDRGTMINLRKGDLSKGRKSQALDWKTLKRPVMAAAAVGACLTISLVSESISYNSKLKKEDVLLERSMRGFFPGLSSSAARTYLASPKKLDEAIKKELDTQRELATLYSSNARSPLVFLKNLSKDVPSSVVVDMTEFQVGAAAEAPYKTDAPSEARLTFLVSSAQMIEKIADIMPRYLDNPQKSAPEEVSAPDRSGKKFKVTFTGKVKESAYGQ